MTTARVSMTFDVPPLPGGSLDLKRFLAEVPEALPDEPEISPVARAIGDLVDQAVTSAVEHALATRDAPAPAEAMTLDEAAKRLRCSTRTVTRHLRAGRLRGAKAAGHGSRVLVDPASVEALLKQNRF